MKKVIFKLNEFQKIVISMPTQIYNLFRYDEVSITFFNFDQKIRIFENDFAIVAFRILRAKLDNALNGKLNLHTSIGNDIGYLWMKNLYGKSKKLIYEYSNEGQRLWVGLRYLLWSTTSGNPESWLYEKNGKFILEITPTYRLPTIKEKKSGNYLTYRQFLKKYKPLLVTSISKETAKRWLKKTEKILEIIEGNDSKYFINKTPNNNTK